MKGSFLPFKRCADDTTVRRPTKNTSRPTDQKHIELRGIASICDLHARAQDQTSGLESELDAGEEEPVPARKHPARSIAGGALLVAVATAWERERRAEGSAGGAPRAGVAVAAAAGGEQGPRALRVRAGALVERRARPPRAAGLSPPSPPPPPLERPHTCFDVFTPDSPFGRSASAASLSNCNPWEESKVVVSVTVEGSVGPVKAMVRLGASVGEAIAAVVERYAKEGRSPRLDPAAAEAFQLHHSHFCLQSLNKNDKIGDVGGRNFYLHKNDGNNRIYLQSEESGTNLVGGEIAHSFGGQQIVAINHDQFFAIFIKKLDKIGRLTKRIWRLLTCNCT
uniref:DUF7054 domain-containing protein n=1 Tax=Oryza barthii TaxID=65489 RepID=A0A0D3F4R2_9ORYZ